MDGRLNLFLLLPFHVQVFRQISLSLFFSSLAQPKIFFLQKDLGEIMLGIENPLMKAEKKEASKRLIWV